MNYVLLFQVASLPHHITNNSIDCRSYQSNSSDGADAAAAADAAMTHFPLIASILREHNTAIGGWVRVVCDDAVSV